MEFEWDSSKEESNYQKHGITFLEAIETFFDPKGFQLVDAKHSKKEKRFYWVGKSKSGKILTTWFTKRGPKFRIIGSANWRKMRRLYETAKTD